MDKSIFVTKTFWLNVLGPAFLWLASKYGITIDADTQAAIVLGAMGLANVVVRFYTKGQVTVAASLPGPAIKIVAPLLVASALPLAACGVTTPPSGTVDTRSQEQATFDDACWTITTSEASFKAYQGKGGALTPEVVADYNALTLPLDAACAGPLPTDARQFYAQAIIDSAAILGMITSNK